MPASRPPPYTHPPPALALPCCPTMTPSPPPPPPPIRPPPCCLLPYLEDGVDLDSPLKQVVGEVHLLGHRAAVHLAKGRGGRGQGVLLRREGGGLRVWAAVCVCVGCPGLAQPLIWATHGGQQTIACTWSGPHLTYLPPARPPASPAPIALNPSTFALTPAAVQAPWQPYEHLHLNPANLLSLQTLQTSEPANPANLRA